jgi:hypothetical protein
MGREDPPTGQEGGRAAELDGGCAGWEKEERSPLVLTQIRMEGGGRGEPSQLVVLEQVAQSDPLEDGPIPGVLMDAESLGDHR